MNECLRDNGGCDQDAQCINFDGGFRCVCDAGFSGDGYTCQDIDECSEDPSLCPNGDCLNFPGSFRCECDMGFMHPDTGEDKDCVDIDECELFDNVCVNGNCENQNGAFKCYCESGFKLGKIHSICKRRGILLVILWLFSMILSLSNQITHSDIVNQASKSEDIRKSVNKEGVNLKT